MESLFAVLSLRAEKYRLSGKNPSLFTEIISVEFWEVPICSFYSLKSDADFLGESLLISEKLFVLKKVSFSRLFPF